MFPLIAITVIVAWCAAACWVTGRQRVAALWMVLTLLSITTTVYVYYGEQAKPVSQQSTTQLSDEFPQQASADSEITTRPVTQAVMP